VLAIPRCPDTGIGLQTEKQTNHLRGVPGPTPPTPPWPTGSTSRKYGGTGLGWPQKGARNLAPLGGEIKLTSAPGAAAPQALPAADHTSAEEARK